MPSCAVPYRTIAQALTDMCVVPGARLDICVNNSASPFAMRAADPRPERAAARGPLPQGHPARAEALRRARGGLQARAVRAGRPREHAARRRGAPPLLCSCTQLLVLPLYYFIALYSLRNLYSTRNTLYNLITSSLALL